MRKGDYRERASGGVGITETWEWLIENNPALAEDTATYTTYQPTDWSAESGELEPGPMGVCPSCFLERSLSGGCAC